MKAIENTSENTMYLECGVCLAGATCPVSDKEATFLRRQGYPTIEIDDKEDEPEEVPDIPEFVSNTDESEEPDTDEFGPLRDTQAWNELPPNVRQSITRKRNNKYGPP